ncbi:hypothetical protein TrRE_jg13315 [Triparma retinervis]|uniref:Peptidase C1A papain C-terminal domain-containing protein n=1 Tax=Triparma retinervis TaxID=2557542 RepID=A0A9W7AK45_9STRA|nr:hypothetical protein TrRE_jg13315 [Triparma retinervis]
MKFIVLSILSATALARENSAGFLNRLGVPDHENTFAVLKARADDVNDDLFVHAELFTGAKDSIPASFDSVENWPECSKVIGTIRDQSNCGCCWAFGAASAASDRACISSNATIAVPFSAQDTCFNAQRSGCNGGQLDTPWEFFKNEGVVTGTQSLEDSADTPSDPFFGANLCSAFSLPHCHHHGPEGHGGDPYPAEGDAGCESQSTPRGPTSCDDGASDEHGDFKSDKYSFKGQVEFYPNDVATIQNAIMTGGPVETAFTVYADFEDYTGGVYQHTTNQSVGGHAVRIVGWGTDEESGQDYWKVANSWNPYWGEEGYFRIIRGTNEGGIESQCVASSADSVWDKKSAL